MFSVIEKKYRHPAIDKYISTDFVKNFKLIRSGKYRKYQFTSKQGYVIKCGGLLNPLRARFYPKYKYKTRGYRGKKKGSDEIEGIRVDNAIFNYIKSKKKLPCKMSRQVVKYLEITLGHTLQASQLPVYVADFKCCTQIDIITMSKKGNLFAWELKCGYAGVGSQGIIMPGVPNTRYNHYELQRFYSSKALAKCIPLNIRNTKVLNVFVEVDRAKHKKPLYCVKARKQPAWTKKLK